MLLCLIFLSGQAVAQTALYPGDIAVLSMTSDREDCGLTPLSDEISFVCFQDITSGTEIDITDNGWEILNPNFFGDNEGTIRMTRTGGTIPRGTIITFEGQLVAGTWTYKALAPDALWSFTDLNAPSGYFNLDSGGDQLFFMQGGDWDNMGGNGIHRASYSGRLLHGANLGEVWEADGSVHHSNLPDGMDPCHTFMLPPGSAPFHSAKYDGPMTLADPFIWLRRISNPENNISLADCATFQATPPFYPAMIPFEDHGVSLNCIVCDGCDPHNDGLLFSLPPAGLFDVVYTDGTDTFLLEDIMNGHVTPVTLHETTEFHILSVAPDGNCPLYSNLGDIVTVTVPSFDPGEFAEILICEDFTP